MYEHVERSFNLWEDLTNHILSKANFSLQAINAFHAMHYSNIFSCFIRNLIECSARYQSYNSQRLIFFQYSLKSQNRTSQLLRAIIVKWNKKNVVKMKITEEGNSALVGAIPFWGDYPGPRFEDKFRSANQIDGISKTSGYKMAAS